MNERLRINFSLDRAENPVLYDNLLQFAKGITRSNRLRHLANAGLIAEITQYLDNSPKYVTTPVDADKQRAMSIASSELFGPAID